MDELEMARFLVPHQASKHNLESFQVIFCIKFFKAKFIWKPFITSTIYIYIYIGLSSHCAKKDIPSPTQKKEWTKVGKTFMLPCQLGVKSS